MAWLLVLCSTLVEARTQLNENIVAEYLKLQKEFSLVSCTPKIEENFNNLLKNYRGDGRYIPVLLDGKLNDKAIKNLITLMYQKSIWINEQIEYVKKIDDYAYLEKILIKLKKDLDLYYVNRKIDHINAIRDGLEEFKNKAPFLLSYKFPLDHLKLRTEYEMYKNGTSKEARQRANATYFYRSIVQDGSFDKDLLRNDSIFRAAFDTLYLSFQEKPRTKNEITDNERVDILFIANNFINLLSDGKNALINRLTAWKLRNDRSIVFYQDLILSPPNINEVTLAARANALTKLKEFVLQEEAKTYVYWSKQSELMQALFVLETILYNEVGRIDAPDALERKDVAQIIINRFDNEKYNSLSNMDSIKKYLPLDLATDKNKWLNILFKEGEFSFTYFYIPGNFHIYCPDMSRIGNFYRKENARIGLEHLNHPRKDFRALRYFSRVGMFGRISMDSLWSDFQALPELPGNPVKNHHKIQNAVDAGHARFLYKFTNNDLKKSFQVIELKNKKYVLEENNTKNIYYYRSPHHFKYFAPIK
jgi:hypothetical protein